jgi:hypothetical protein
MLLSFADIRSAAAKDPVSMHDKRMRRVGVGVPSRDGTTRKSRKIAGSIGGRTRSSLGKPRQIVGVTWTKGLLGSRQA